MKDDILDMVLPEFQVWKWFEKQLGSHGIPCTRSGHKITWLPPPPISEGEDLRGRTSSCLYTTVSLFLTLRKNREPVVHRESVRFVDNQTKHARCWPVVWLWTRLVEFNVWGLILSTHWTKMFHTQVSIKKFIRYLLIQKVPGYTQLWSCVHTHCSYAQS